MIKKILLIIVAIIVLVAITEIILWQTQGNKIPFLPGKNIPIDTSIEASPTGE